MKAYRKFPHFHGNYHKKIYLNQGTKALKFTTKGEPENYLKRIDKNLKKNQITRTMSFVPHSTVINFPKSLNNKMLRNVRFSNLSISLKLKRTHVNIFEG